MKTLISKTNPETIYQLIEDGNKLPIAYNIKTPAKVIEVLERARVSRLRIKLHYGDILTGKDWNEENDTTGYIGLSKGYEARFPILVHNARSMGGGSILETSILKIQEAKGKRVLYQAANFQQSVFEIKESAEIGYTHSLYINGELYSNHKSLKSAQLLQKKLS